jgi:hypothetical protein
MSPEVLDEMRTPDGSRGLLSFATMRIAKGCVNALIHVIARFSARRDHGFQRTVVEEVLREFYLANVGRFLWNGMKTAIRKSFLSDPLQGGGAAFLQKVKSLWNCGKKPELFLIGHSAGSIYICEFLKAAQRADLPADMQVSVILINAACNFGELSEALDIALNRITGIRQFAMGTRREGEDRLVAKAPFLYAGDLLYLVSGILEAQPDMPLVGMERYYSGQAPYMGADFDEILAVQVPGFFGKAHSLIWSQSTDADYPCDLRTHGNFAADGATVEGIKAVIQHGF